MRALTRRTRSRQRDSGAGPASRQTRSGPAGSAGVLLRLQQQVGNRAVQHFVEGESPSVVMRQYDWIEPAAATGDANPISETTVSDEFIDETYRKWKQGEALKRGKQKLEQRRRDLALFGKTDIPYDREVQVADNTELLARQERQFDHLERRKKAERAKATARLIKGAKELKQPGGTMGYMAYKIKHGLFGGGKPENPDEALLWMKVGNMLGSLLQKRTTAKAAGPGHSRIRYPRK